MKEIETDISSVYPLVTEEEVSRHYSACKQAYEDLLHKQIIGCEFTGWLDLPSSIEASLISEIRNTAQSLSDSCELLVVIGIGGSYLGARAVIEALNHHFGSTFSGRKAPEILYAGHQLSSSYMADLLDVLNTKEYALAVISKSGTTTEPALAFRFIREHIETKYGKEAARKRIIAITDEEKGTLKELADAEQYRQFYIPDDVGGRYSVLTPVGLVPIAIAGFDIAQLIAGALHMEERLKSLPEPADNPAAQYACARLACYHNGFPVELLATYEPSLFFFAEWWKQLFGESEGKEHKGIFPAAAGFSTDLHSLGQFIQEGSRLMFETTIVTGEARRSLTIPDSATDGDGLNFLSGKTLHDVNGMARLGTLLAHTEGGVPNICIMLPQISEYYMGQLIYFFEFACALSAGMMGVNPFNQPGVEAYKNNMFALLGKPGYDGLAAGILEKLKHKG